MSSSENTFVLADSFSYLNKGDAGIIIGMVEDIKTRFPESNFVLLSETPEIDEEKYKFSPTGMRSPFRDIYKKDTYPRKFVGFVFAHIILMWGLIYRLTRGKLPCFGLFRLVSTYGDSTAVIVSGGDKYYNYNDGVVRCIKGLPKIYEALLGIILGKPVVMYAHSGGPFRNRPRNVILRWVLRKFAVRTVREPISQRHFSELGVDTELTADAAFNLSESNQKVAVQELEKAGVDTEKPVAGLTVREWSFPDSENSEKEDEQYREGVSDLLEYLDDGGYQAVLFPQVIGPNMDDRVLSREIANGHPNATVLEGDYDVSVLREMYGLCNIFIGTRMHSNIFALSKITPVVAISYRHKTDGIMEMLGLEEYTVKINEVNESLRTKVERLLKDEEDVVSRLEDEIPRMRDAVGRNSVLIKRAVESQE